MKRGVFDIVEVGFAAIFFAMFWVMTRSVEFVAFLGLMAYLFNRLIKSYIR